MLKDKNFKDKDLQQVYNLFKRDLNSKEDKLKKLQAKLDLALKSIGKHKK